MSTDLLKFESADPPDVFCYACVKIYINLSEVF